VQIVKYHDRSSLSTADARDDEECVRLYELPTPLQAEVIRYVLGIRERMAVSEEILRRLKASAFQISPHGEAT
jgi:hypothetical protein